VRKLNQKTYIQLKPQKCKIQYTEWNKIHFWKNALGAFTKIITAVNITELQNTIILHIP
jgi:hypothetical protein